MLIFSNVPWKEIMSTTHSMFELNYFKYFYARVGLGGGRDSSVGIATCYGLDGPGIESRWGTRFSAPAQTGPGATQPLYNGYRFFPGGKVDGA